MLKKNPHEILKLTQKHIGFVKEKSPSKRFLPRQFLSRLHKRTDWQTIFINSFVHQNIERNKHAKNLTTNIDFLY